MKLALFSLFVLVLILSGCVNNNPYCPSNYFVVEEEGMLRCYERIEYAAGISCGMFDMNINCAKIEYEQAKNCPLACIESVKGVN